MAKLTVGMPTFDDYHGVYFSINAIRLYHQEVLDDLEFVVVDNNPSSRHGRATERFVKSIHGTYIPFTKWTSTSVGKNLVFSHATSDLVLCIDAHVLLFPGTLYRLIEFYQKYPSCYDLLQGPMVNTSLSLSTHMDDVWSGHMWGTWGTDDRAADPNSPPFEIGMQGTGLMACRRDGWLGFNDLFRGFGGQAGYIHEKYRQAGLKTLCLPFLRWMHRFDRPDGPIYRVDIIDKFRNYIIGFKELNLDITPLLQHFRPSLGDSKMLTLISEVESVLLDPSRVSVVMITHNICGDKLNESIESFLRQNYANKELIIMNDGPSLNSPLNNIKIININTGRDDASVINEAISYATGGSMVMWSDCHVYLPGYLNSVVSGLQSDSVWNCGGAWDISASQPVFRPSRGLAGMAFSRKAFELVRTFSKLYDTGNGLSKLSIVIPDCKPSPCQILLPCWSRDYESIIHVTEVAE